ncbi:hypothetical protein ANN_27255 [Periplaneta americana]|uniref:Uncharacterized protein n=1 Tax=Periplaneta americana TaxID=6978 RepID=A0ABQ8RXJ4_PERAM|nr:hypothetical protein ANN_27255 [Periplaneta americana]
MHDGAPEHYCRNVMAYFNAAYPGQWIGSAGPTPWPARSPDINLLDFYVWGRLKSLVYASAAPNVEVLQQRIEHACGIVRNELNCLCNVQKSLRRRAQTYSQTTEKGYIIDPTIRIETGSSQPEDVNQEKINIYLPTVDYFKAKYQLEDIEVICLLFGACGVIPKFFESFRKTFELPQTLTADIITSVLKRSCQILSHHIHSV